MIRRVLERNPHTLAEGKRATRDMENTYKDYERLWRKENESIPQFNPIRPRLQKRSLD